MESDKDMVIDIGEEDPSEKTCRICRDGSTAESRLVSPCLCSGSMAYVHNACLATWVRRRKNRSCEVCQHSFALRSPSRLRDRARALCFQAKRLPGSRAALLWGLPCLVIFLAVTFFLTLRAIWMKALTSGSVSMWLINFFKHSYLLELFLVAGVLMVLIGYLFFILHCEEKLLLFHRIAFVALNIGCLFANLISGVVQRKKHRVYPDGSFELDVPEDRLGKSHHGDFIEVFLPELDPDSFNVAFGILVAYLGLTVVLLGASVWSLSNPSVLPMEFLDYPRPPAGQTSSVGQVPGSPDASSPFLGNAEDESHEVTDADVWSSSSVSVVSEERDSEVETEV